MSGSYLLAGDIVSGKEGRATFNINGRIQDGFFIKSLDATVTKNKSEINTLGSRGTQHKSVGYSGSGSMTIYYVTSLFREMTAEYMKTGKDTYFDITIENDDPTSSIGKQTVVLYNCNTDSSIFAKLDTENTELDEDLDFTFEYGEILNSFQTPANMRR